MSDPVKLTTITMQLTYTDGSSGVVEVEDPELDALPTIVLDAMREHAQQRVQRATADAMVDELYQILAPNHPRGAERVGALVKWVHRYEVQIYGGAHDDK